MSIDVYRISKHFQDKKVVDQLTFKVDKGQIVGLLGPNGAGKSTTMRMLTGYIQPSEGVVCVCGYDINKNPLKAKKKIGYLPEHNPLYLDMYVHEYLRFMGSLYGMGKKKCITRAYEVVAQCGIGDMQNKKLGTLSKGYRQRVGLAQTLMHDPDVLILDEPTVGLDPNQLSHIRELIKELSREKAVLLSTHIMQEVEAICDRVLVINQGKLCLAASLNELAQKGNDQFIVTFKEVVSIEQLQHIGAVKKIEIIDAHKCILYASNSREVYENIFHFIKQQGLTLQRLEQKKESLADIFAQLTNPDNLKAS